MVEFVKKTLATKDCTLDATYSDLYDGTNPYLKIGGIKEPKKALLRFPIAEKPTYGDATLHGGEIGLYATGLKLGNTSNYPTFNVYKLKTSSDGIDWGSEGQIRTIPRGKPIVGLPSSAASGATWASNDTIKVIAHDLDTGDTVWWSPVNVRYDDVDIQPLVPEQRYYAIKVDRDHIKIASTIANAIAGTPVSINDTAGNHTPSPASDADGPWGYIRSEKYTQDIHVVTAQADSNVDCIAENFNGSQYREDDLEFIPVTRNVVRKGGPYLDEEGAKKLQDNPTDDWSQGQEGKGAWLKFGSLGIESASNIRKWYGNGKEGDDFAIRLTSHKTNADGTGWWRTKKDAGRWGGGHEYIKKGHESVKFEIADSIEGQELYGDEVTPMNSIFHIVRGAAEFQQAADTEDGENELQATGAIRFSTKKKLTGGQSCNIYQFWKKDAFGVSYPSASTANVTTDRQECMMLYKGLPFPSKETLLLDSSKLSHGVYPISNSADIDKPQQEQDLSVTMCVNFNKLEKAYSTEHDGDQDDVTLRRAFTVVFASTEPRTGEQLYDYMERITNDDRAFDDDDGATACGFSIVNTNAGIRILEAHNWVFDNSNYDLYYNNLLNTSSAVTTKGTYMEEGEWYNIKCIFPVALNGMGTLVVENQEGDQVQSVSNSGVHQLIPRILKNLKNIGGSAWYSQEESTSNPMAEEWVQHMSIWVTNTKTQYATGSHNGTDWMADKEDRDTSNDIFIDHISVNGVNLDHENATVGQNGSRSKIYITGSKSSDASMDDGITDQTNIRYHKDERKKASNTHIALGFEDPSQILSNHRRERSWRYLFWNGYQSANISADNKISWTADNTLPLTTYAEAGTDSSQEWFTPLPDHGFRTYGDSSEHHQANGGLDAGLPYVFTDLGAGIMQELAPAVSTWYSDGHVTPGAQMSYEAVDTRELYFSQTKDSDTAGHKGAKQSMHRMCPSIGATFHGVSGVTSKQITILSGPNNGNGVYWNTGQKVVYYPNDLTPCGVISSGAADGSFTDTPTGYYWERSSDTAGYLHASYANAIAGEDATRLVVTDGGSGTHLLYTYDYYVNRKFFIDGFSSKGLSQFIFEPVQYNGGSATTSLNKKFIDTDENLPVTNVSGVLKDAGGVTTLSDISTISDLDLVKRENITCASKILEVEGAVFNKNTNSGGQSVQTITCRVDTVKPLRSVEGTTYRAWLAGGSAATTSYASGLNVTIIDEERIQVHGWDGKTDGGAIMTDTEGIDGAHGNAASSGLCRLWIGPEKYWMNFVIRPQTGDTSDGFANLPNKTYNSVCVVAPFDTTTSANEYEHTYSAGEYDAWGVPGATYNESTYNADKVSGIRGAYINQWKPTPDLNPNETIFDLADYGFGGPTEDKEALGAENGVMGGYVAKFIPRTTKLNKVKMPKIFAAGEAKVEGDNVDVMIQQETLTSDAVMTMASTDNGAFPTPFLLTTFLDEKPANPTDFKIVPYEKDPFYPELQWSSSDSDLWYGFIIIDDMPINNQYHHSLLHVPFDEDLTDVASSYDDDKGHYYANTGTATVVYGHRYRNTTVTPSGIHANSALSSPGTEKIPAVGVKLYDNEEGLAGKTKYFTSGSYAEFNWDSTTAGSSDFSYPVDEMSVVVHITPASWGANRWIASFNENDDSSTAKDSWGIFLDASGQINAYVAAAPGTTHPDGTTVGQEFAELKSTTKVPIDGTPTCIILTVDTQLHSGNVKLFINGKLEDQTGARGTRSTNNWPTDTDGLGGDAIFYDTNGTKEALFIGAKSQNGSAVGQNNFEGRIEEFVWYDKCIYPVIPQDGKYVLEKPLEELVAGSTASSSKSYIARLFVKDYHNIRGKTSGEVAASSQISWKKAAFELYT